MEAAKSYWNTLRQNILHPKMDDEEVERCLKKVRDKLPTPVFWLLGKTQSGKTSLIRAITGATDAEIGNGFKPCTKTARMYPFPQEDECMLKFLDTRGLGEVAYDPAEDMGVFESQAHLIIVVLKALDHAQECVLKPLREILREHPHWPLIVVQISLHEGYPRHDFPHIQPYPYHEYPFPPSVPIDLARSLSAQRELFADWDAQFVAVDFTLPEDGFQPVHYGLTSLWQAIELSMPAGLRGMLQDVREAHQTLRDVYFRRAHQHVLFYAAASGAAAALPVPLLDIPLLLALQAKMCHSISKVYGQPKNAHQAVEILSTMGSGFALRMLGRELLKFIPILGSVVSAGYASACTYAMGRTLCTYFSRVKAGDVPSEEARTRMWDEAFEQGRERFRNYFQNLEQTGPS